MNAEQLAREIAGEICKEPMRTNYEMADIIAKRIKPLVDDADKWSFVNAFHIRAGSLHMDGTSSFVLGGSLGRALTVEEAIAERMKTREWKRKRGTP